MANESPVAAIASDLIHPAALARVASYPERQKASLLPSLKARQNYLSLEWGAAASILPSFATAKLDSVH